jgi:hypothetical protein
MHGLPDVSHFRITAGDVDVTGLQKWPAGSFRVFHLASSVEFVVEVPTGGTIALKAENMSTNHTVEHAWEMLRIQAPGMYEHVTFNYRGLLQPGLSIQAEVKREQVQLTVVFEVIRRRESRYENQIIWHMWTNEDIWDHFFAFDKRLLSIECYEVENRRPWYQNMAIHFKFKESDVPDTLGSDGGVDGGMNRRGNFLPRIGPEPKGRESGKELFRLAGRTGPVDTDVAEETSAGTDSEDDEEGSDIHKMTKIRHALVTLRRPMTITLTGQYEWNGSWEGVLYQRFVRGADKMPDEIMGPVQDIYSEIKEVAIMAGATSLPISVQGIDIPRDQIEVEVHRRGEEIHVVYSTADQKGFSVGKFHAQIKPQFPEALSVIFGIQQNEKNCDIASRLEMITASWFGDQYGPPWNANL